LGKRVNVSEDVLGHPFSARKPVKEGVHYEVLAYTDWADTFVPTMVRWNHGALDDFRNPAQSRLNQRRALEYARASKLPVGGAVLKVGGKEYVWRTGDRSYKAAQEKAGELRKRGYKAVIRKERVAGKPAYTVYVRREAKR